MTLDLLAPRSRQLDVLVLYLEGAAKTENPEPLELTNASFALASRVLFDWKSHLLTQRRAVTPEGAFLYYQRLKGEL